jgi:hypothetical protein
MSACGRESMTMPDHEKDDQQEIKDMQRDAAPVRVVQTPRLNSARSDALRETHKGLVRAEQNMSNLLQGIAGVPSRCPPRPGQTHTGEAGELDKSHRVPFFFAHSAPEADSISSG